MSAPGIAARESAAPAAHGAFDAEADVVVVGGGGGGLPAALFSRWLGNDVILLEKAPELGGTAAKAAFWYWVPNNGRCARSASRTARRTSCATSRACRGPQHYDPDSPTLGLSEWEHAQCRAIYESASPAAELLAEKGALPYRHVRRRCPTTGPSCPRTRRRPGGCSSARGRARVDVRRRRRSASAR